MSRHKMPRGRLSANRKPTPDEIASSKLIPYCVARYPKYEIAIHNQVVAEYLEAVEREEIKRLIITMPPRHGKSLLLQSYIEWYIGRHPDEETIYATYSGDKAQDVGENVKNAFSMDEYKYIFPGTKLSLTSASKSKMSIRGGGNLYFVGINEAVTGRGCNMLIIDDPHKREEDATSPAMINHIRNWYTSVAYTRLMPKNAIVVCHTRWTTDDLIGWLIKEHKHEKWVELRLPAIAEEDDLLGRKVGEALWPSRYSERVLANVKKTMKSTRRWNSIYQQRPVPEEGALVKSDWFSRKFYRFDGQFIYFRTPSGEFIQERVTKIVQSWDTSYKKEEINDPSACTTWAITNVGYALIDGFRERIEYPDLKKRIVSKYDEFGPSVVLIEDRSSGQSLIQEFKYTHIPIVGVKVTRDKVVRMKDETDAIEAGKIFLPEYDPPWLFDYVEELTVFPYGSEDDYTDTTSMFLNWIKGKKRSFNRRPAPKYWK